VIEKPQNPDVETPLKELNDTLRTAVERVRETPPPQEALDRALSRAQRLGSPKARPWRWALKPAMVAAVAAVLLLALTLWLFSPPTQESRGLAENNLKQLGLATQNLECTALVMDGTSNTILFLDGEDKVQGIVLNRRTGPGRLDEKEKKEKAESYDPIVENAFELARRTPVSTFSADVHTASYSNVRRFLLKENCLPPADAVRIAELINYFPYTYADPVGQAPVAFATNITECPWNTKHHLVRVALKGKQISPSEMPPRNFVFLVDTSGSMNCENRLPLFKKSLKLLVEQLNANDRVAIVTYAGEAGLALDSTPGGDKETINKVIDALNADGSTNGGEGIVLAYRIAQKNFLKGGLNRVILGTDGDFNVGVTKEEDLLKLIDEQRKSGVFLSILGFGMGNLKDAMMEKLAYHGNGHYAYIDTEAEAHKVFVEQGAALLTIAKDVKVQVEFNPKRVGAYRLIGYENRLMKAEDFHDDSKQGGSIGTGHTVTALYEIVPAGLQMPEPGLDPAKWQQTQKAIVADEDEWLTLSMRYKDPEAETSELLKQQLTGPVVKLADAPTDLRFAAAVASFGMLLRDSPYRGEATYASVRKLAKANLGDDPNGHRDEFVALVDVAAELAKKQDAEKKDGEKKED
jgi:Ca-activated chloride channel family protein